MASIKHIPSHKSCVNLQPSSRAKKPNITPVPYCQHCQFYHGANQVVCGPHPYGPNSETCSDYVPKVSDLNQGQATRNKWSRKHYPDWEFCQAFLVMVLAMLMGILSSGFIAWWLTTHFPTPTTKTITRSGWIR
ncbi:MAG: hypothetical protein JO235_03475 [Chroococcidiopsidaceae cyanobacterium CP_BM_RX_35]|nr:hypothetical protein [Chroococcidiopsidaceae cyanobacterium CP_BM_RX_35]